MQPVDDSVHARSRIAEVLDWADRLGLTDVGIHLNDALIALDQAIPLQPAIASDSDAPGRQDRQLDKEG